MDFGKKINVFISSGCGEGKDRYNLIRNDIKNRLESLGYVKTYIYEADTCASTKQVRSAYLDELDDSDLVIFLIDNADGVFEGVRNEYQRAKVTGKHCFYIFCDENSKVVTDIEKEIKTPESGRCPVNEDAILSVFMKRMDSDSPIIKSCILEHIKDFRDSQNPFVKGIIEKGNVDNNFIVRLRKSIFRYAWE